MVLTGLLILITVTGLRTLLATLEIATTLTATIGLEIATLAATILPTLEITTALKISTAVALKITTALAIKISLTTETAEPVLRFYNFRFGSRFNFLLTLSIH